MPLGGSCKAFLVGLLAYWPPRGVEEHKSPA